ncbi:short-chain dehydrogenase/reductase sdr [Nitritalea halalkaliphila LW7]|uniref:Short-chain dehydrogenase/reductase sdr n=1 Tax=Nitritalea halalkaliphila LW7 TaxID=1189621 RepID=I5C544_9BACT|nr:SDR family oxidoreductase [Nitritalea halalkaliphila]EIM76946.1 short-chain dehydrogenase/reductase sdr [Nitritalea halalkaliphila LW7]
MELKDKTAVITGGSGGIGLATARQFLQEGIRGVLLVDISEEALAEAQATLADERVFTFKADVSQAEEVAAYTAFAEEKWQRIDLLFLNAGIEGRVATIAEYPEEVFDQVMAVNVKGVFLGMRAAFPLMERQGGGAILITSSVAGLQGTAKTIAYTTSKHATIGAMRVAALEGAPHGIRVNSMHPSPVDNRMMRSLEEGFAPGAGMEVKKNFEQMIPLGAMAPTRRWPSSPPSCFLTAVNSLLVRLM